MDSLKQETYIRGTKMAISPIVGSKAFYHIATTKHVSTGMRIGSRILIAVPNKARYDMFLDAMVQSFAPKYLITESGDYSSLDKDTLNAFLRKVMAWHKITELTEE